jgi:hypothetical protein
MKLVRLSKVKIPDVPNNIPDYSERKTPPQMPRLHMLAAVVGSRNSGKTTTAIRMLKMYVQSKSYDKIFWWSPTASREAKIKAFSEDCDKKGVPLEIISHFNEGEFSQLLDWFRSEIDEYRLYKKRLEVWQRFKNCKDVSEMSLEDLSLLEEMDFEKPTTTYKHGPPSFALVWDDEIGNKTIFSPTCKGVTSQFWILHRHLSCSVFILSQIVANGIPRQIRGNISLWILFSCKSEKLKKDVADELAFKCAPETLLKMWDFATQNQHDFLFCDYDCADVNFMFRRNFTDVMVLDSTDENDKIKSTDNYNDTQHISDKTKVCREVKG